MAHCPTDIREKRVCLDEVGTGRRRVVMSFGVKGPREREIVPPSESVTLRCYLLTTRPMSRSCPIKREETQRSS